MLGLPSAVSGGAPAAESQPAQQALASAGQPRKPVAFDASEGTPLDPLRNKSWDLNSAKSVPTALAYH